MPGTPLNRVFAQPGAAGVTTVGQLRFRLTKALPGIDPDLWDGWIQDRYTQVLDELPWTRAEKTVAVPTVPTYGVGTVAVVNGAIAVIVAGGVFDPTMTGRSIRIANDGEYYEFTCTSSSTGALDRAYTGISASYVEYVVFQSVYQLPADLRILGDVRLLEPARSLRRVNRGELNTISANRTPLGDPIMYAPYMDDNSAPPRMQIEILPVPEDASSLVVDYTADATQLSGAGISLAPWLRSSVLYEGARASGLDQMEKYTGAALAEKRFLELLQQMKNTEYQRIPSQQLKMASRFTRHRQTRGNNRPRLPD